ncbi:4-hydroxyphenylpyruvate dioxygenase [Thermobifida halotolerans]|uniref:4-hydroxyphenylpyruvate dioxygenase n=2 Tax=Thermobifida halotolerans TaxID=483545 RepID=A0A399G4X0_9ACTN|nr:4-hydroxyphenylpyruvate dioxygenase [Thermobifida halotolerans]
MLVDHVKFYVSDVEAAEKRFVDSYGLSVYATSSLSDPKPRVRSRGIGGGRIRLVFTEPLADDHPGAAYLDRHGDGVADIALLVADASASFNEAVRRGARPVTPPTERDGVTTATIAGFGDVTHTFVQRARGVDERALPSLAPVSAAAPSGRSPGLTEIDHFAVCLEAGDLDPTVRFYEEVLDFEMIFTEHIVVGSQAMHSKVVQSASGAVTLTLIEPDLSRTPGQIDEFLKNHGGAGVQHIAFTADDIVEAVESIGSRGVEFLDTPPTYYDLLAERLEVARHSVDDLRRLSVLVDEDHDGQLFQIFARSTHPRRTFFLELIERLGARTFGSGNIKALYEAVELQRSGQGAR